MARIVVLQYEDDDDAAELLGLQGFLGLSGKVLGTYYLPSPRIHCRCNRKPNLTNWRRHRKLGLPVCTLCNRPSVHWRDGIIARLEIALGKAMS